MRARMPVFKVMLALVVAGALVAPGTIAGALFHEPGGIAGQVSNADGTGLANICVNVRDANSGWWAGETRTRADGTYSVSLSEGTYKIFFIECDEYYYFYYDYYEPTYLSEWYDDEPDFNSADPVTVTTGETTTGIDAVLSRAGRIVGTVIGPDGKPVAGICVSAEGGPSSSYRRATTDIDGAYRVGGLRPGEYRVRFSDCNRMPARYLAEWFDDAPDRSSSTQVGVLAGQETDGIDAQLAIGGRIRGLITDAEATALNGICAYAYDASLELAGAGFSDGAGLYIIGGLLTGSYKVGFFDCNYPGQYREEWYSDKPDVVSGDPVGVAQPDDTTGIDAALTRARIDLAITGMAIENLPVRTDLGDIAAPGWARRVHVDVANLGDVGVGWARLTVRACSETFSFCRMIGEDYLGLEQGQSQHRAYDWNALGSAGDVDVIAELCVGGDAKPENNRAQARHYAIVGGLGIGVDVIEPSPSGSYYYPCYFFFP